jgi:hypothetical protein
MLYTPLRFRLWLSGRSFASASRADPRRLGSGRNGTGGVCARVAVTVAVNDSAEAVTPPRICR